MFQAIWMNKREIFNPESYVTPRMLVRDPQILVRKQGLILRTTAETEAIGINTLDEIEKAMA